MSTHVRTPISTVRGRWQAPALRAVTTVALLAGMAGLFLPGLAVVAVVLVIAVPLIRVMWLVVRFAQERDWRFVLTGLGLLGVVLTGLFSAVI